MNNDAYLMNNLKLKTMFPIFQLKNIDFKLLEEGKREKEM